MSYGEVSITGNVYCPYCGQWTGKNACVDKPPYICQFCGAEVYILPRQENFYKEDEKWKLLYGLI